MNVSESLVDQVRGALIEKVKGGAVVVVLNGKSLSSSRKRSKAALEFGFAELLHELRSAEDPERLRVLFAALGHNAALLSKHHEVFSDLLDLLFIYDWSAGADVSAAFESILLGLVSSNAGFLEPVLKVVLSNFYPSETDDNDEDSDDEDDEDDNDDSNEMGTSKGETKMRKESEAASASAAKFERLHSLIQSVLRRVPLGSSSLLNVLVITFPPPGLVTDKQLCFFRQLQRICEYVPVLRTRILSLLMERALALDSEIRLSELVELEVTTKMKVAVTAAVETNVATCNNEEMFAMDDGSDSEDDSDIEMEQGLEALVLEDDKAAEVKRMRELAERLDQLLLLLIEQSDREMNKGRRDAKIFFSLLLNLFDCMVLPSRSSKFVQFVLFYSCRTRADFVDKFVERLLQRALNTTSAQTGSINSNTVRTGSKAGDVSLQLNAASYLASFLARGLFIHEDSTRSALQHIMQWIGTYNAAIEMQLSQNTLKEDPGAQTVIDPMDHLQLFALSQAAVYTLLFKGEDLPTEALNQMDWGVLVYCRLRPFMYFSTNLLAEFASVAKVKGLLTTPHIAEMANEVSRRRAAEQELKPAIPDAVTNYNNNLLLRTDISGSVDNKVVLDGGDNSLAAGGMMSKGKGKTDKEDAVSLVQSAICSHFPFDPCLLKRVAGHVEPFYQRWLSKDGDDHTEAYEVCEAAIESADAFAEAGDAQALAEAQRAEDALENDAQRLPEPIKIHGLSERTARMLNALGAGALGGIFAHAAASTSSLKDDGENRKKGRHGGSPHEHHWSLNIAPGSYASSADSGVMNSMSSSQGVLRTSVVVGRGVLGGTTTMSASTGAAGSRNHSNSIVSSYDSTLSSTVLNGVPIPTTSNKGARGVSIATAEDEEGLSGSW